MLKRNFFIGTVAGILFSSAVFAQNNTAPYTFTATPTTQQNPVLEPNQLHNLPYVRLFLSMNAVPMIVWNNQGGLVAANDAYLKMIGYSREDLRSKHIDWATITPKEYQHLDQRCLDQLKNSEFCTPYVKKYQRKDGSLVDVKLWNAREPGGSNIAIILPVNEKIVQ